MDEFVLQLLQNKLYNIFVFAVQEKMAIYNLNFQLKTL